MASEVDSEFPYRVRIVDRGVDCRDPVCRHRFRFPDIFRGRELSTNFFSQTFWAPRENPGKIPRYPTEKVWFPWVSKDIPNFLAPTLSRRRPPPHLKISGPKSLGLGSFFVPELFGTFPHIFSLYQSFSEFVLQSFFLEFKGFCYCFSSRKRKETKRELKKRKDQTILHVSCCTSVLLRLSKPDCCSYFLSIPAHSSHKLQT